MKVLCNVSDEGEEQLYVVRREFRSANKKEVDGVEELLLVVTERLVSYLLSPVSLPPSESQLRGQNTLFILKPYNRNKKV